MTVLRVLTRGAAVVLLVLLAAPFAWVIATGDFLMTVTGDSMTPTYRRGDVLVVQQPSGRELAQRGQVVIVSFDPSAGSGGPMYVHRVVEPLADGGAWLQGDGNEDRDPRPVAQDAVIGTPRLVVAGSPARVLAVTQTLLGRVVLGGVALALLLVPVGRSAGRRVGAHVDPGRGADDAKGSRRASAGARGREG